MVPNISPVASRDRPPSINRSSTAMVILSILYFLPTDVTMQDAAIASVRGGDAICDKICRLVRGHKAFVESVSFTLDEFGTAQLRSLHTAQPHTIEVNDANDIESEANILTRYDIEVDLGSRGAFLDLVCGPKRFYVRQGYDELYEYVAEYWQSQDQYRVVLLGNAGTGKSWFQVYALKQLLNCDKDKREFDIVIRQVDSTFHVIDLEETVVYLWEISTIRIKALSLGMKRTLYFFEPGGNGITPPLEVFLPSLSTLSPYIQRIKEYEKRLCETVYFWPWSSGELRAVIRDANLPIDDATFSDRYHKFGGILRHVLGEDKRAEGKLQERLKEISIDILTSPTLNVDRDTSRNNVGGFLICYDNRSIKGKDRFAKKNLEYSSAYVVEAVQAKIRTLPVKETMANLLDQLAERKIDISGKNLERAAVELLSQGSRFKWQRKEVGVNEGGWKDFLVSKRTITLQYTLINHLHQSNTIIAPAMMRFPVVDFVFSWSNFSKSQEAPPVVSFQCTWGESHKVQLEGLYNLRRNHMDISDEQLLEIYMVCPKQEDVYASRDKQDFLAGALENDLKISNKTFVPSSQLKTIWNNTKIFVIRPKIDDSSSWEKQISPYLSNV